ncbi:MAG: DNA topoisomerase IV subunit B [Neisseria sp.]|nr:DNA topoisomerase IV subunit B [Neisseria sp.]
MSKQSYSESSITVLKGLEPVKERPGMYTRTENPTHICQEVIDNAADEALGGFATEIDVTVHADGSLSVRDNGRGIPTGLHPEEGVPVVELVFTRLHAGGKFNKKDGGSAYAFSGGLHGVGVSVTNALSTRLEVCVRREGKIRKMTFSGGDVIEALHETGTCAVKDSGTEVRIWPDGRYFESPQYSIPELERLLRAKAVLLPGVTVSLTRPAKDCVEPLRQTWHYPQGLQDYLRNLTAGSQAATPVFAAENYLADGTEDFSAGEGAAFALVWLEDGQPGGESYVNLIPTPLHGTHLAGLKQAVFAAVSRFISHHNLLPPRVKIQSDDVFDRVAFVLSARILDPQFQGQTKDRLTNRDALKLVSAVSVDPIELWLNQNIDTGKKIADMAIKQAQARMRSAKKIEKKKGSGVAVLPGKLIPCESQDIRENELFLVEGNSAGGTAKDARIKDTQAILPLRGKVLNSFEVHRDQLFSNTEIHDISVAVGIDPHPPGETPPDLDSLNYGKIIILSDADVDGSHIQVLLLTLFYTHFPELVRRGHIYVAQPPLFRIDVNAQGRNKPARKLYALDQKELDGILERLRQDGVKENGYSISRFKGLGEMNAEQLKDTTMNPDTRRLLQVRIPEHEQAATREIFVKLMGKGEAAGRRAWMEAEGDKAGLDI